MRQNEARAVAVKAHTPRVRLATIRLLRLSMVASLLFPALLFVYASFVSYRENRALADERIERSLDLLAEQALKVFQSIDLALDNVGQSLSGRSDAEIRASEQVLGADLKRIVYALTEIQSIWVFDENGHALLSTQEYPAPNPPQGYARRDFFRVHIDPSMGTYIGDVFAAPDGEKLFTVSRRRETPEGTFAGVIQASIFATDFDRFYASVVRSSGLRFAILREDGTFLARFPRRSDWPLRVDANSVFHNHLDGGLFTATSPIDGVERRVGIRKLEHWPIYVNVGIETQTIRSEWLAAMAPHLFFGIPATLILFATLAVVLQRTNRLYAEQDRREAAEDALRQAQKLEAIGHLTGGVAHDFNNLLTVIIGNLEIAQRQLTATTEAARDRLMRALANATRGAQRATTLTQRLLAASRQQPLAPQPLDLNKLMSGLSDFLVRSLGEHISLKVVGAGNLWKVETDPAQLESAILNLVVNARDAMHDGGKLTVEMSNAYLDEEYCRRHIDLAPGQYVQIAVSDTGIGMTPDVMARAFEPFFTTKPLGQGTGLGLSQVYSFVKQTGGHVKIYSEPGEGTTVKVYLPRLVGEVGAEEVVSSIPVEGRPGETILVVEDDDDVRSYVVETLRGLNYRVCEASDATGALRLIDYDGEHANLLLSDVMLPGMNGRKLAEKVKRRQPGIKVLFMTGYSPSAVLHQGRLDADVAMIEKPLTSARLAAKVREILDIATAPSTHLD
jgi:two-component system, NtrC family, sensor kinase